MNFRRILVANRGEIACRVLRTARSLGYETVTVYSDADAQAPHVRLADQAVLIGPAPVAQSYLDVDRIMAAARESGADALHPGYGFLSENPALAAACAAADIVFVGPPVEAIASMADKGAARRRMAAAGVACVPGFDEPDASDGMLVAAASEVGFPLMIKAAAGGGGRGMRIVAAPEALPAAITAARNEARSAFGSDALILERVINRPRHVEVQVFADDHGTVVHLGERDCSIQRRHQKVIEEAPSPAVSPELRETMGAAAVAAARAIGYRGAGTVEFLLAADGAFHFLEMNTRLQVEHPVTEAITGLDLVALQFRVAEGRPLGFAQDDVRFDGWSIEARLYAEDPARDFLPATGTLACWAVPDGPGIRVDAGVESGSVVSPHYDPLLAKLIAAGPTREVARRRLVRALRNTVALGVTTNRDFLIDALTDDRYGEGMATTAFISEAWPDGVAPAAPGDRRLAAAAVLDALAERDTCRARSPGVPSALLGWSSGASHGDRRAYRLDDRDIELVVVAGPDDTFEVALGERACKVAVLERAGTRARIELDGERIAACCVAGADAVDYADGGRTFRLLRPGAVGAGRSDADGRRVLAPMHGVIVAVDVGAGDQVAVGDRLLVLEAMKMQHELRAAVAGTVAAPRAAVGAQVAEGALLIEVEPAATSEAAR